MKNSKIEWTDHTFNPWIGCTKVSPGCAHCYAETRDLRLHGGAHWGKGAPRHRTSTVNWREPLKWNREAILAQSVYNAEPSYFHMGEPSPRRPRVFCASLADWLDDEVPIVWLADLLDLIRLTPHLDWLLLTKRPQNWRRLLELLDGLCLGEKRHELGSFVAAWLAGKAPANVWLGITVENQAMADLRVPQLLSIPAKVRFLSCEPLLGPVRLDWVHLGCRKWISKEQIHWVICGGESGPQARPMHPDWARGLRDQCKAAGVPFLFKQWGEWAPATPLKLEDLKKNGPDRRWVGINGSMEPIGKSPTVLAARLERVGKHAAGRLLDGVEHNEFPAS